MAVAGYEFRSAVWRMPRACGMVASHLKEGSVACPELSPQDLFCITLVHEQVLRTCLAHSSTLINHADILFCQ